MGLLCNNNLTVKLKTLITSIQGQLGLSCLKWYRHEELDPYVISILEYLNSRLILSGACTIIQRLQEFTGFYEDGTEMILSGNTKDLVYLVGINTADPEYREEIFTLAWGILMSSIYMQLMYNYAGVFDDSSVSSVDCHSGCYKSECEGLIGSGVTSSLGGYGNWESSNVKGNCGCNNN